MSDVAVTDADVESEPDPDEQSHTMHTDNSIAHAHAAEELLSDTAEIPTISPTVTSPE